jgi:Amt family ammonium transporter
MKRFIPWLLLMVLVCTAALNAAEPTVEQRLADVEAYLKNAPRAETSTLNVPGPGHNAWMMTSSALVLFMTLPGLALFYGGLVRRKNVLSVLAQCLGLAGIVGILWWAVGYSLSFSSGNGILGGLKWAFWSGVDATPNPTYSPWTSHNLFAVYQMMFAIITPALIVGSIAERMKFSAVMLFCVLWMFLVYFPVCHMMWGADGMMNGLGNDAAKIKAIDFAGGIVVHMTSGWSALVLCLLIGHRKGYGRDQITPHSMTLCMVGTGMLWVGWYGFNAGSALAADSVAANAFVNTTLAAVSGCVTWAGIEYFIRRKASILGFCSGAVAGLATITPGSGFVSPGAAVLIGFLASVASFLACSKLKAKYKYDDALDTFGVHAVGGTLGTLLAGVFASMSINGGLSAPRIQALVGHTLWLEQLKAGAIVLVWSVLGTLAIAWLVKVLVGGLRVSEEIEHGGLDLNEHGEEAYTD